MIKRLKELLFENKSVRQTITKNIFWLSTGQIGSRLVRAIIIIYAARVLGAGEYGVFSYILGLASFFTIFADIGVNALITRDIANNPEQKTKYFATSFWIKIGLLVFTTLLVVFVAPYFAKIQKAVLLIPFVALFSIFDSLRDFIAAYLRGLEKMEIEALIVIFMNVTIVTAGFIILSFSRTSGALLSSYIASVGVSTIFATFIIRKEFFKAFHVGNFDKKLAKQVLSSCWPIAFSGVLGTFMLNTDMIMLGWWRTAEEIGYYSAGQRIIQILYTLPALLASSTFPVISRFVKNNDRQKEKAITEKSMIIAFLIAMPIAIGGIILSQPIIKFIYGQEYLPGSLSFQILLLSPLLIFPGVFLSNLILAHNQQKKVVAYIAIGSIGNIVFNALLIPFWGIAGSSIATVTAQLLNYGLTWRFIKKVSFFETFRYLRKIIIAAASMGILSFALNKLGIHVIANIIISAGFYFGILYLLKEAILDEVKILFARFKK